MYISYFSLVFYYSLGRGGRGKFLIIGVGENYKNPCFTISKLIFLNKIKGKITEYIRVEKSDCLDIFIL